MRSILYDPPEIEYLNGHPFPKVTPKRTHAVVQLKLGEVVMRCAGDRGEVGSEWRFSLGEVDHTPSELVPDLAFVSHQRLDKLSHRKAEQPPFAPEIAIEIRSPSTRSRLLNEKIFKYLATGAVLVLDVDPQRQRINAYSADGRRVYSASDRFRHPLAPWLEFDVAAIFPARRKRT